MKQLLFTLFTLLITFHVSGQTQEIIVLDSLTKTPVSFPLVVANSTAFHGTAEGVCDFSNIQLSDTTPVQFSSMGYASKTLSHIQDIDTVFLAKLDYELKEVVVNSSSKKVKTERIGYYDLRNKFILFMGHGLGEHQIVAIFIPNKKKEERLIQEIIIPTRRKVKSSMIKIDLLEVSADGTPGKSLLPEALIYPKRKFKKKTDIKHLGIQLPKNGIFVSMQWMYDDKKHTGEEEQEEEKEEEEEKSYALVGSNKVEESVAYWKLLHPNKPGYTKWLNLNSTNTDEHITPAFGLEVYTE